MIGLKRGSVVLLPHQSLWEDVAAKTILLLRSLLNDVAIDVQHVGSTAIKMCVQNRLLILPWESRRWTA